MSRRRLWMAPKSKQIDVNPNKMMQISGATLETETVFFLKNEKYNFKYLIMSLHYFSHYMNNFMLMFVIVYMKPMVK